MAGPPPQGFGATSQGLGRRQRVTRSSDFDEAYTKGRKFVGRFMVIWVRNCEGEASRLGVVTGRKVGGAVLRVRARRRIREAYRRNRVHFSGVFDMIIVARATIVRASWGEIVEDLMTLAQRAGLCAAP